MKTKYNKTQLNPDQIMERHVYHRDQFGHYLRWSHVLKITKIGDKVLDWGCGSGNLLELLYRNMHKCYKYLGLDVRKATIEEAKHRWEKIKWAEFKEADLVNGTFFYGIDWQYIISFEVIEHIGKFNGDLFLQNVVRHMNKDTVFLLSTPCYDEKVGAAENHMIFNPTTNQQEVGEYTYQEMKDLLSKYFVIEKHWGTFASKKDYKEYMNDWQKQYYESVSEYFDSNILSNLMAPLFPEHSRNVMWQCRLKIQPQNPVLMEQTVKDSIEV